VSDWHEEMTAAVNRRRLAINGETRWTKKRLQAEATIARLSAQRPATVEEQPEPEAQAAEIRSSLTADVAPIFGVSSSPFAPEGDLIGNLDSGTVA